MELVNTNLWGFLLDMTALALCGVTIAYIAMKKRHLGRTEAMPAGEDRIRNVVETTFMQLVAQHQNATFPRPLGAVEADKTPAGRPALKRPPEPDGRRAASVNVPAKRKETEGIHRVSATPARPADTVRIFECTRSGMSVEKISETLAVPRCEVELIAKFRQGQPAGQNGWL